MYYRLNLSKKKSVWINLLNDKKSKQKRKTILFKRIPYKIKSNGKVSYILTVVVCKLMNIHWNYGILRQTIDSYVIILINVKQYYINGLYNSIFKIWKYDYFVFIVG